MLEHICHIIRARVLEVLVKVDHTGKEWIEWCTQIGCLWVHCALTTLWDAKCFFVVCNTHLSEALGLVAVHRRRRWE